jgi:hypothetical protein
MQKTIRMWIFAAFAFYIFVKLVDFLGFSAVTYRTAMEEIRSSAKHATVGALDQLPPSLAHLMERLGRQQSVEPSTAPLAPAPFAVLQKPVQVQLGGGRPNEGDLVEQEQQRLELEQAGWSLTGEEQIRALTELVMTPAELEDMRKNRREKLWAAPDEDLWSNTLKPGKGSLHESTIIFLPVC